MRDPPDLGIARHLQHGYRIHDGDDQTAVGLFTNDYVAGQQKADVGFGLQCAMRERRVAGAEDAVGPSLGAQLDLHGGLHVDLGQDPEALGRQRLGDTRDTEAEILLVEIAVKAVDGCVLRGR